MSLLPLAHAQERVLSQIDALGTARLRIGATRGLVIAQAVTAKEDIPPFANTGMDGFARARP